MQRILLIGGGGYIGTEVAKYFLNKKYKVTILDNFIYNHEFSVNRIISDNNLELFKDDLSNIDLLSDIIKNIDHVVFLAGLVGDPITKKYPDLSHQINSKSILKSLNFILKCKIDNLIFISTCSNYGILKDNKKATEESSLNPLSLYAKSKVEIENFILKNKKNFKSSATILRFATAFGLSDRMRFDLTVNQFTQEAYVNKKLIIYDSETWRPYCHILDFAYLIEKVIHAEKKLVSYQVFNAGADINNHRKIDIVNKIIKFIKPVEIEYKKNGFDVRDYNVNFGKVEGTLNFIPKFSVEDGVIEILNALNNKKFNELENYPEKFGNYNISK